MFEQARFARIDPMSQHAPSEQGTSLGPELLSTLLDSARELHAILGADGTILFASTGFTRALGYHSEELIGRLITAFLHPNEVAQARAHLAELAAAPGTTLVERCRLRYRLTLRDLSAVMRLRGFTVSHECIRQWEAKLLPVKGEA